VRLRASPNISLPSPKPIITSGLEIADAGLTSLALAIWPSAGARVGERKDQPTPASVAGTPAAGFPPLSPNGKHLSRHGNAERAARSYSRASSNRSTELGKIPTGSQVRRAPKRPTLH
jgi:hypothetical protein